jgi:predicted NACHT family NTPase
MPPIDTTALTTIFTWVWSQYGKEITNKTLKAAWERLRWEDRALAYAQKVQRLYSTMQILGQAKPVPLEGIYTAVSLLDRPTAWRRYTLKEMQAEFAGRRYFRAEDEKEKRRDGLDMVRSGENLFILGKPGAGKTTFLKHVALRGVSGELERVPIFVGLKQLSDSGLAVFDFVVNEFDVCDFPDAAAYLDRLLKAGKCSSMGWTRLM